MDFYNNHQGHLTLFSIVAGDFPAIFCWDEYSSQLFSAPWLRMLSVLGAQTGDVGKTIPCPELIPARKMRNGHSRFQKLLIHLYWNRKCCDCNKSKQFHHFW